MSSRAAPEEPRPSPLHDRHVSAGAAFTDFAGWQMPVRYGSDLAEHHAVRRAAGVFDLSHMAEFRITGPSARELLHRALAGDFDTMPIGRAKYTLMLDESGGVIDDLIVYRTEETDYLVVANASNRVPVHEELRRAAATVDGVQLVDETDTTALIAVQGPRALETLAGVVGLTPGATPFADLAYYRCAPADFAGTDVLVARTGYTGEDGFELYIPVQAAAQLWDAVLDAGTATGAVPCGLACRDTLRLEAGMPLYGHELDAGTHPDQAGLERTVRADLRARVAAAPASRRLVGLSGEGKRAPRAGYDVYADDAGSRPIGAITSGALSPTLGHPIAMAYVDPEHTQAGTELAVDIRGTRVPVTVTPLPFYRREKDNP